MKCCVVVALSFGFEFAFATPQLMNIVNHILSLTVADRLFVVHLDTLGSEYDG